MRHVMVGLGVVGCLLGAAHAALGQTAAAQNVEVDPVQCWWRTSTAAVRVGEPFSIHLTCAALETEAATAVIDRSRLGTASVQFPPFEVTGGTQSADYVTAGRRFLQYHYTVRLIAEDAFGSDVVVPALPITYRIESRVQQDGAVVGREQTYELPPLTVRVNALVPAGAFHIREAPVPTLDDIAAREFRARMFRLLALILFAVAGLLLVLTAVRWFRQTRKADMDAARHFLPARAVLAGVKRELKAIEQQTRGGWDPEAVARALAAARVVASYVAGAPVAQREIEQASPGELDFSTGLLTRRRIAVSGAATPLLLRRAHAAGMDEALTALTAARYGRTPASEAAGLDEALATVLAAADRMAARHTWAAELLRSTRQALGARTRRAWAR